MKNISKIRKSIIFVAAIALIFGACNNDPIYQDEHYKNVIYLLSGTDNIYVASYSLDELESTKYATIGCGGSNTNEKEVVIELAPAPEFVDRFNSFNYDYEEHYAQLLPPSKYTIESYTVRLPAHSDYHYARLPIAVKPLGLSPDSIYFIPLRIMSVSEYEVNENKQFVLFRATIENEYATQYPQTYYRMSGEMKSPVTNTVLSGVKLVHPLTKNRIRMFVGAEQFTENTTPDFIARNSVVVEIREDNSVVVTPYDENRMDVKPLDRVEADLFYNEYLPEFQQGLATLRVLHLQYQFQRISDDGVPGDWFEVSERLVRVEED